MSRQNDFIIHQMLNPEEILIVGNAKRFPPSERSARIKDQSDFQKNYILEHGEDEWYRRCQEMKEWEENRYRD
jgi:hypothetical protein